MNREGVELLFVKENILKPRSKKLKIVDESPTEFTVALVNPPPPPPPPIPQPLEDDTELDVLNEYTKGNGGKPFLLHRYPRMFRKGKNPFMKVEMMTPEDLHLCTGLSERQFWELVQVLSDTDLKKHVDLPMASVVVLYR